MRGRAQILAAIRSANAERTEPPHPGDFPGEPDPSRDAAADFAERFTETGGEAHHFEHDRDAAAWFARFAEGFSSCAIGLGVPDAFRSGLEPSTPADAALGLSWARGGVAETGSLALDARDGRKVQLLPPTHVVLVRRDRITHTLADALRSWGDELPSAMGLHSGPSKSADIGQMMVQGVHGPGRLVALILPPE